MQTSQPCWGQPLSGLRASGPDAIGYYGCTAAFDACGRVQGPERFSGPGGQRAALSNLLPQFGLFKVEEQRQEGVGVLDASKGDAYKLVCLQVNFSLGLSAWRIFEAGVLVEVGGKELRTGKGRREGRGRGGSEGRAGLG